jgi:hypothetical protein
VFQLGQDFKEPSTQKRKLNFVHLSPSSFEHEWHHHLDNSNSPYLVGRVKKSRRRLPVQLLCPIFGLFVERFERRQIERNVGKLVDQLCSEMEPYCNIESEREEKFHAKFREMLNNSISFSKIQRSGVSSDGTMLHPSSNCVVFNLEVKKEMGYSGDSFMQNIQHFVYFLENKESSACRPCFLVELVGPNVCVSGALVAEEYFTCDKLTPMLSLVRTGVRNEFEALCSLFSSLVQSLEDLWRFYDAGFHNTVIKCDVPALSFFDQLGLRNPVPLVRYVFQATLGEIPVIVKFAESYCLELHELLASHEMAPKILNVGQAPPFWKIIVMEFMDLKPVCELQDHAQSIKTSVERILALMKENHFVHGDFRATNVLGVMQDGEFQGQVVVIDFDWSGKNGVQKYPCQLSSLIQWPEGCYSGAYLDYAHDEFWAKSFFN